MTQRLEHLDMESKQLMVVRNTGRGWFNRGIAMAVLFRIEHDLLPLTVKNFIKHMREYGSELDWVYVQGVWTNRDRGQVWELGGTNLAMMPASDVKCTFYGGPEGARTHYKGTLLTMLCDRAMTCALSEGMQSARYLFPGEVLTNQ